MIIRITKVDQVKNMPQDITSDQPVSRKTYPAYISWAIILGIAIFITAFRVYLSQIPLERDEGEYAYAGQLILQGVPPYMSAYNMKMPGIYAVYAVIMAIFGQTHTGIRLGLLVINIATIILIFLLGRRLLDSFAGIAASAYFAILSLSPSVMGVSANAEHFVIFAVIAGFLLLLRAVRSGPVTFFFWSGLFFGAAFVIKQHGGIFTIPAIIYLFSELWKRRPVIWPRIILICALFLMGITIPFILTVIVLFLAGVFDKFWFWTFTYAREYASLMPFSTENFIRTISWIIHPSLLIWSLAVIGLTALLWNRKMWPFSLFVGLFFIFSFLSVFPGFYFRPHYFILLLPAIAILGGIGTSSIGRLLPAGRFLPLKRGIPVFLAAVAFLYPVYFQRIFLFEPNPATASRIMYGSSLDPFPESPEIAKYIDKHTTKNDLIAVLGSEPQIYFYSKRRSATGYIYMYGLMEEHKFADEMQREMIAEIEKARPKLLIFVNIPTSWLTSVFSQRPIFDWFGQYNKKYYDRVGFADIISPDLTVYRWGNDCVGYEPFSKNWVAVYQRRDSFSEGTKAETGVVDHAKEAETLNEVGVELGKTGNIDRAIEMFNKAIKVDPKNADSYNNLGFAYAKKGENKRAEEYFKKAIEIDPNHKKARMNLDYIRSLEDADNKQAQNK
ncbi:MAG: hypothetical protein A2Z72_04200 [Omnitrophica bacterium RBG_13_46_9]|nr:MAG: hypothetical protein A2Z72_04200 [Omnitrophica bacterium RBG_13_46_9]